MVWTNSVGRLPLQVLLRSNEGKRVEKIEDNGAAWSWFSILNFAPHRWMEQFYYFLEYEWNSSWAFRKSASIYDDIEECAIELDTCITFSG
jgi:hypothetical protein